MRFNAKQNKLSVSRLVYSIVALTLMLMMLITASHAWMSNRLTSQMQNTEEYITIDADAGLEMNYGDQDSSDGSININNVVSSDFKLTECSSADGKNIFFPLSEYQEIRATNSPEEDPDAPTDNPDGDFVDKAGTKDFIYRKATANDKNTKYISIDLSLKSKDPTEVYLSNDSYIRGNAAKAIRVAFIENVPGGKSTVFDNGVQNFGDTNWAIQAYKNNSPTLTKCEAETFAGYAFRTPLLTLNANEERFITVNIWLEGTDKDCTDSVANLSDLDIYIKFSTSVQEQESYKFVDHTLEKWVDDDECYVFIIDTEGNRIDMRKSENYETDYTWLVELPETTQIAQFVRYNPVISSDEPEQWNYWNAGAAGDCKTYNAVGHSAGLWMDDMETTQITFYDGTPDKVILEQSEFTKMHVAYTTVDGNGNEISMNYKMSFQWERARWCIMIPSDVTDITFLWGDTYEENLSIDEGTAYLYWENTYRGENIYYAATNYDGTGHWGNKLLYLDGSSYHNDCMFAAYFYGDYGEAWTGMFATTEKGRYVAVVPEGTTGVVFCRYMEYSGWWDWSNVYNQTQNSLENFGSNNLLKLSGYSNGELTGTWYYTSDP